MSKYSFTNEDFQKAVSENYSVAAVLRQLGIHTVGGGNYKTIHKKVKELNLDTSHWTGQGHLKGKRNTYVKPVRKWLRVYENNPK